MRKILLNENFDVKQKIQKKFYPNKKISKNSKSIPTKNKKMKKKIIQPKKRQKNEKAHPQKFHLRANNKRAPKFKKLVNEKNKNERVLRVTRFHRSINNEPFNIRLYSTLPQGKDF